MLGFALLALTFYGAFRLLKQLELPNQVCLVAAGLATVLIAPTALSMVVVFLQTVTRPAVLNVPLIVPALMLLCFGAGVLSSTRVIRKLDELMTHKPIGPFRP